MKFSRAILFGMCLAVAPVAVMAQTNKSEFELMQSIVANPDNTPRPVFPVPSRRQLLWNETEFYAFFHYGMDTYTGKEWGDGTEDESTFAPTRVPDPAQWLRVAKQAGMKGGIAVVKHHDGFCLWPTATTTHSILSSSSENARKTNIPRDFARAARKLNMKYGFYVSPWDLSSKYWGEKDADGNYTDNYAKKVFFPQCVELAKYGADQFEMWFDGATGGDHAGYYGGEYGGKGTTGYRKIDNAQTFYDMPNLRDSIHALLPNVIMWGLGGEVRWIGNEAGYSGETCWSMGNAENGDENGWLWHPGESDAKATTGGWFWKKNEKVLSAERLFQMYLETVGRNATLILNLPPDVNGLVPEATAKRMAELGNMLRTRLGVDLARKAVITASEERVAGQHRNYSVRNLTDGKRDTYWATNDGTTKASITLTWAKPTIVRYVQLMEHIKLGQRVRSFTVETSEDGVNYTQRATNIATTTIGYKRIIPLNGSTQKSYDGEGYKVRAMRITINDSKACPLIENLSVY